MADANIRVDWADLAQKGKNMVTESERINDELTNIEKAIEELGTKWQSNASEQMLTYIRKIKANTIPRYTTVVKEYGDFLQTASSTYQSTENEIVGKANELLDFQ